MKNQTSALMILTIFAAGLSTGSLIEYNKINGFEWPFLIGYALTVGTAIAGYIYLKKGYK